VAETRFVLMMAVYYKKVSIIIYQEIIADIKGKQYLTATNNIDFMIFTCRISTNV